MICTFLGHRDCPKTIKPTLKAEIERLIENGVDSFLVGNNGYFDLYVQQVLQEIEEKNPKIKYSIVLAYMPNNRTRFVVDSKKTLVPDGIEGIIPKYAISYRNKWLIEKSDYVITYIKHTFGGAYQFASLAKKQGKACINIAGEKL